MPVAFIWPDDLEVISPKRVIPPPYPVPAVKDATLSLGSKYIQLHSFFFTLPLLFALGKSKLMLVPKSELCVYSSAIGKRNNRKLYFLYFYSAGLSSAIYWNWLHPSLRHLYDYLENNMYLYLYFNLYLYLNLLSVLVFQVQSIGTDCTLSATELTLVSAN